MDLGGHYRTETRSGRSESRFGRSVPVRDQLWKVREWIWEVYSGQRPSLEDLRVDLEGMYQAETGSARSLPVRDRSWEEYTCHIPAIGCVFR